MSKVKDRTRAGQYIYRSGCRVSRREYDKYHRELKELAEERRLKAIGLTRGKPKIPIARLAGLEKAQKQIMTLKEIRDGNS